MCSPMLLGYNRSFNNFQTEKIVTVIATENVSGNRSSFFKKKIYVTQTQLSFQTKTQLGFQTETQKTRFLFGNPVAGVRHYCRTPTYIYLKKKLLDILLLPRFYFSSSFFLVTLPLLLSCFSSSPKSFARKYHHYFFFSCYTQNIKKKNCLKKTKYWYM